jgi:hypothetical protein
MQKNWYTTFDLDYYKNVVDGTRGFKNNPELEIYNHVLKKTERAQT